MQRSWTDEFAEMAARAVEAMKLGPGVSPDTQLGPLVSERYLQKVDDCVQIGRDDGAEVLTGGRHADGELAGGYLYTPTVFAGV